MGKSDMTRSIVEAISRGEPGMEPLRNDAWLGRLQPGDKFTVEGRGAGRVSGEFVLASMDDTVEESIPEGYVLALQEIQGGVPRAHLLSKDMTVTLVGGSTMSSDASGYAAAVSKAKEPSHGPYIDPMKKLMLKKTGGTGKFTTHD